MEKDWGKNMFLKKKRIRSRVFWSFRFSFWKLEKKSHEKNKGIWNTNFSINFFSTQEGKIRERKRVRKIFLLGIVAMNWILYGLKFKKTWAKLRQNDSFFFLIYDELRKIETQSVLWDFFFQKKIKKVSFKKI